MENDNLDRSLRAVLGDSAPPAIHAAAAKQFADLARASRATRRPALVWLWAGLSCAGIAAGVAFALVLLVSPTPSWAQVAERFRNLRFFHATAFFTENAGQPPEKVELWVAQDHRLRAHYRGLVFFGIDGRLVSVLSAESGEEIPLDTLALRTRRSDDLARDPYPALALVRGIARLGEMSEFSLGNLLQLFRRQRGALEPTPNTDAGVGGDLAVFDCGGKNATEWMRLWVLKRSELPVRLRVWDAADGGQTDLLFDYATRMPEEAFDAAQVQTAIRGQSGVTNRLYALLQDSGGRPLTPAQLFAARGGYHLPDIDTVGRTPEGVVWVLSRRVENHRADGVPLYGWSRLTDDLGQDYTHRIVGWIAADDAMLEYFVPARLGADFRLPRNYTLACLDQPSGAASEAAAPAATIGSVAIANWQETAAIPDLLRAEQNRIGGRTNWQLLNLDEAAETHDWAKFDRLAATIPGSPETDPVALARDVKMVHRRIFTRQREAAAVLCAQLYPLVTDGVRAGQPLYANIVRWHIADLYRAGHREEARRLANRHVAEALHRSKIEGPRFAIDLLLELHLAGLGEAEARTFFDHDVIGLPAVRDRLDKLQLFREGPSAPPPAAAVRSSSNLPPLSS